MQLKTKLLLVLVITTCLTTVVKTTYSQSTLAEKILLDYKIDTGIRLHAGLVRKLTHGQIEKDIVQWVYDNFDTIGAAGSGFNLSNHNLTANGSYNHNWAGYPLDITNISQLILQDSSGKNLISSNTPASILLSLGQFSTSGMYAITVNKNTGEVMIDSAYYLPTTFGGGLGAVLQKTGTWTSAWAAITNISLITSYNGSGTAGNGLWVIRAHNRYKNRTTSITVATYTPPFDAEYYISGFFNANSNTGDTYYYLDYTDQQGVLHTGEKLALLSTPTMSVDINCFEIMAKGGTAITLYTTISTGTIDYDISGTITQLSN